MNFKDNYIDSIADELLTDLAERFFGKRKQLENTIQTLQEHVDALKKKKTQVDMKVRFLNLLLLTPDNIKAFYKSIGIDSDAYALPPEAADKALPPSISSALTAKGEYLKLVLWAYEKLQESVAGYLHGAPDFGSETTLPENIEAHYTLIDNMCLVINEEIEKVNREMAPGQMLDCFRRFDPAGEEKRYITGGGSDYSDDCTLNQRMAFKPLDCRSLDLPKLPALPPLKEVKSAISDFCKNLYSHETHKALAVIDTLRLRIKTLREAEKTDPPQKV